MIASLPDLKRSTFRVLEVQPTREYPEENETPQNETTFLTSPLGKTESELRDIRIVGL